MQVEFSERICTALEKIAKNTEPQQPTDMQTAYAMCIGICIGFSEQIKEAMEEPDLFKRAQHLRALESRGRKMAENYQKDIDELKAAKAVKNATD